MESRSTQAMDANAGFQTRFRSTDESGEQVNPRVLLDMRRAHRVPDMLRVQESWLAAREKRAAVACRAHPASHRSRPSNHPRLCRADRRRSLSSRNRFALLGTTTVVPGSFSELDSTSLNSNEREMRSGSSPRPFKNCSRLCFNCRIRNVDEGIQGIPPITMSSILGCVAPVMAMVSPSQPRPAVIHKTSISVIGPVCAKVVILQRDPGRDFQHEQHFKPSCGERRG